MRGVLCLLALASIQATVVADASKSGEPTKSPLASETSSTKGPTTPSMTGNGLENLPPAANEEEKKNAIVSAMTTQLTNLMLSAEFNGRVEVKSATDYLCGLDGVISGLKEFITKGVAAADEIDGSKCLTITYSLKKIDFSYLNYFAQSPGATSPGGKLHIVYDDTEVELVLNVPHFQKLDTSSCVLNVIDFRVKKLGSPHVTLEANSLVRKPLIKHTIKSIMKTNVEMVKNKIEIQVLMKIHEMLSGSLVCKDDDLKHLVTAKGGFHPQTYTDDFQKYCSPSDLDLKKVL